jgi:hypothetical protein
MIPTRMRLPILAIIALSAAVPLRAQSSPQTQGQAQKKSSAQPVYQDPLDLPCAKILAVPSSDFIAQVVAIDDSNVDGQLRGIRQYGACYDGRTNRLAASLGKQGKGPLMGARGNFGDFESALKNFTAKALEEAQQSPKVPLGPVKTEYAALYEKQFRYAFYQSYSQKLQKRPSSETAENSGGSAKTSPADAQSSSRSSPEPKSEPDPLTLAKNRFGELLAAMPEDKRHEIHAAFGQIFERSSIGEQWKLEIYRYAIFLLEPPTGKPFSAPPF